MTNKKATTSCDNFFKILYVAVGVWYKPTSSFPIPQEHDNTTYYIALLLSIDNNFIVVSMYHLFREHASPVHVQTSVAS